MGSAKVALIDPPAIYEACNIKRRRRTRSAMQTIRDAIREALERDHPMTVRQLFYRLVSAGVIDKTEAEYQRAVVRLTGEMRRRGELEFDWIADNTRWMRKPDSHSSLERFLWDAAKTYRRSVWDQQKVYVEIWLEKDALSGVLYDVTEAWDVPLMVTRGYGSLSFLFSAAEAIREQKKPAYLYYFGDYDPSGVDISRHVEQSIREFAPKAEVVFERVAVNAEQITAMNLPTRPTKKSDQRSKNFRGESVEVDAIEPETLRDMCQACILQHIDADAYERMKAIEHAEHKTLIALAKGRLKK
jgi:hypothetical protein